MSALITLVSPSGDAAHLLADSLSYRVGGKHAGSASKVRTFPNANCVVGSRGNMRLVSRVLTLLERCSNFEQMRSVVEADAPGVFAVRLWRALLPVRIFRRVHENLLAVDLMIVGFSQVENRILAVNASSCTDRAFVTVESDFMMGPGVPHDVLSSWPHLSPNFSAWPATMMVWMQRLRDLRVAQPELNIPPIGGCAVLTTLTQSAISQRIVHRWDNAPPEAPSQSTGDA